MIGPARGLTSFACAARFRGTVAPARTGPFTGRARAPLVAETAAQQIRALLASLTASWRKGRTQDIAEMLHPSVVFVRPGFAGRAEGRAACVATYDEFLKVALVLRFDESEPSIDLFNDSAVATRRWEMAWEVGGQRSEESGHDIYVLVREGGRWLIAWRTLVSAPPP